MRMDWRMLLLADSGLQLKALAWLARHQLNLLF